MAPGENPARRILLLTWIGRAIVIVPGEEAGRRSWLRSPKFWSDVILVLVVGALSFWYEDIKHEFPWLINWQLKTYSWFSRAPDPKNQPVVGVEIDDDTFYGYMGNTSLYDVTDRSALAKLVTKATDDGAAVIALDINLDRSKIIDDAKEKDNCHLKDAIEKAVKAGIPVVLVFGFRNAKDGEPIPSLFLAPPPPFFIEGAQLGPPASGASSLPKLRGGFDHAPDDRRKVPLEVVRQGVHYWSFALQIVDAYEAYEKAKEIGIKQPTQSRLSEQRKNREFVYTSYFKQCQFHPKSAKDLLCQNSEAQDCKNAEVYASEDKCSSSAAPKEQEQCPESFVSQVWSSLISLFSRSPGGRQAGGSPQPCDLKCLLKDKIVLIGGNRHKYRDGDCQNWADTYPSPVGDVRGMYFQANYIEGLLDLDNRILFTVPRCIATVIDVVLAMLVLFLLSKAPSKLWKLVWVLAVLSVPILLAFGVAHIPVARLIDGVLALLLLGVLFLARQAKANANRWGIFGLRAVFFFVLIILALGLASGLALVPAAYLETALELLLALLGSLLVVLGAFFFASKADLKGWEFGGVAFVLSFPIISACIWAYFDLRGYALDFMLPLVLLCLHPALERYIELFKSYTVDFRKR